MNPNISRISLRMCVFGVLPPAYGEIESNLTLTDFRKEVREEENINLLMVNMQFDLMKGIEKPGFVFQLWYEIVYTAEDKASFEVIKDHVAIAHVIPYLRELVSGLTTRADCQPLIIPPINTLTLYNKYLDANKERKESAEASEEAPEQEKTH
jgi:preprotein translocase subunit SecB